MCLNRVSSYIGLVLVITKKFHDYIVCFIPGMSCYKKLKEWKPYIMNSFNLLLLVTFFSFNKKGLSAYGNYVNIFAMHKNRWLPIKEIILQIRIGEDRIEPKMNPESKLSPK